jgi:hypothetical protein
MMNKKKKVSRSTKMLVLLGCLVVVMGGYALTKSLVAKSEAAEAEANADIEFVSAGEPVEMTWNYGDETYTVKKIEVEAEDADAEDADADAEDATDETADDDSAADTEYKWVWTDDESFELDQTTVEAMASAVSSITADQVLTGVTDYDQYGLAEPDSTITVKTADGMTYTILTGDYNSTAYAYYAMLDGASDVYLVTGDYLDNFEYSIAELEATADEETEETAEG